MSPSEERDVLAKVGIGVWAASFLIGILLGALIATSLCACP